MPKEQESQDGPVERIGVVHVYKDFDTFNGLIESFFFLAQHYDRKRFDWKVCVFNYAGGLDGQRFQASGGQLCNLGAGRGLRGLLSSYRLLKRFLRRDKPQVVVTHDRRGNFIGIPAARSAGIPVVIATETTLMDSATTRVRRLRDKLMHPLLTYLVGTADAFVSNSRAVLDYWRHRRMTEKSYVIYPPFSLSKYNAAKARNVAPHVQKDSFPVVGYVGRLSEEKGLSYLIEALPVVRRRYPQLRLLVAGAGESLRLYQLEVQRHGLEDCVSFLGFVENTFEVLGRLDLLVVPSRSEGFGLIALEGIAMGVPVIASRVGGLPEILDGGTGRLVPPGDVQALEHAITAVLDDPQERQRLRQRGVERAFTEFSPARYVAQFQDLYAKLYEEKRVSL